MPESCICCCCGREVVVERGELPCDVLHGWLMVSCLKGRESIERYSFCSLDCLQKWVALQMPAVPDVFIESLGEESDDS